MDDKTENIELNEDRTNLKILLRLLLNNKFLILQITGIVFIVFFVFAKTTKKVWQGQFQIVLQSKSDKKISPLSMITDSSPGLANIVGKVQSSTKDLKTQIEILKSPSVLVPTFNFVKENNKFGVPMRFQSWRKKYLDIKLKPGTFVMDLSYKDNDKEIILPTLQKISKTYQEYALLEKSKNNENFLTFLEKQIKSYKEISDRSIKSAKQYASENKLIPFSQNSLIVSKGSEDTSNGTNFESLKFSAEVQLLEIDMLIKKLEELGPESDALLYLDKIDDPIKESINKLDIIISNLRSKYKEEDPSLQRALRERSELLNIYRNQYFDKLKALRIKTISKKSSLSRPDNVLINYSELIRQATSDLNSLIMLQREKQFAKIENAQKLEPWKLITKPTLLSYPVAPNKKRLYFIGLLSGFFFGSLFVYVKDKYNGLIYTSDEIEEFLDIPIILSCNPYNENQSNQLIKLFAEQAVKTIGKNKLNIVTLDKSKNSQSEQLINRLEKYIDKDKVLFNRDIFSDESNLMVNYLIVTLTKTNKRKIIDFKDKLSLVDKKINGVIVLDKFI